MHEPFVHHEATLGCTKDAMADPCRTFAADLHELLMKHAVMAASGRAVGIEIAVSPKLGVMLSECDGADRYVHQLRRLEEHIVFDASARALIEAGYVDGQSYEQCLKMADWHPGMRRFMSECGPDGSHEQKQRFTYAQMSTNASLRAEMQFLAQRRS